MTTFHVSVEGLDDLLRRLHSLSAELQNAKGSTPGYAGQTGSGQVGDTLDGYFADWSDGMHIIDSNLESLMDKLSKSAAAYEGTECALVQGMTGGASAG